MLLICFAISVSPAIAAHINVLFGVPFFIWTDYIPAGGIFGMAHACFHCKINLSLPNGLIKGKRSLEIFLIKSSIDVNVKDALKKSNN